MQRVDQSEFFEGFFKQTQTVAPPAPASAPAASPPAGAQPLKPGTQTPAKSQETLKPTSGPRPIADAVSKIISSAPDLNSNFCKVLSPYKFCAPGKNIPRSKMPNFTTPEDVKTFLGELGTAGIKYQENVSEDPNKLKNIQVDVNTDKVTSMITNRKVTNAKEWAKEYGETLTKEELDTLKPITGPGETPVIVSSDNYILDGHHRWAANKAYQLLTGKEAKMAGLVKVNLPVEKIVDFALKSKGAVFKTLKDDVLKPTGHEGYSYAVLGIKDLTGKKPDDKNRKTIAWIRKNDNVVVDPQGKELGKYTDKGIELTQTPEAKQ